MSGSQLDTRHLPDAALKLVMMTLFRRGHDDAAQTHEALETHFPP